MYNKLRHDWEILKKDSNGIQVVRRSDNLIIGIGDVVKHYGNPTAKIISFKKSVFDDAITYNYDTITSCNTPYPEVLREKECGRHFSCISNVNRVEIFSKQTNRVHNVWWSREGARRDKLPRYKVIANYPDAEYRVGQTIKAYSETEWVENPYMRKLCDKFPHIFKRIN